MGCYRDNMDISFLWTVYYEYLLVLTIALLSCVYHLKFHAYWRLTLDTYGAIG